MADTAAEDVRSRLIAALQRSGTAIASTDDTLAGQIASAKAAGASDGQVLKCAAEALGVRFLPTPPADTLSADFAAKIPINFARQYKLIAVANGDDRPILALGDLAHWEKADVAARMLQK